MTKDKLGRFHGSKFHSNPWEERFWAKVDKNGPVPPHNPSLGPCWLWTASTDQKGYGFFRYEDSMTRAHVFIYRKMVGDIPDGLQLDHKCRVRNCVNYKGHLEPVTSQENTRRGFGPAGLCARATHCLRGHEFTTENTSITSQGKRMCRLCQRVREAKSYLKRTPELNGRRRACKWASLLKLY